MSKRTTTATDDADRLQEELPEVLTAPLEGTAKLLEDATRIGLEVTLLPFRIMPRSLRDGVAQGIRAGVAASAMLPHALTRAVSEATDSFLGESDEE